MKKSSLSLKEPFSVAIENYKKKNFTLAENLCYKILSIDSNHFDSLVLLSNVHAINKDFVKGFFSPPNSTVPTTLKPCSIGVIPNPLLE